MASVTVELKSDDRFFVLHPDNSFLEYDRVSREWRKSNLCLVKIDDYVSMLDLKIKEICSNINYETEETYSPEIESVIYGEVFDSHEWDDIFDLITFDVDVSSIKIKSVIDFLIKVDSKFIDAIQNLTHFESDSDMDLATMLTIRIKGLFKHLKKADRVKEEDVRKLKMILLVTNMVMKNLAEIKTSSIKSNIEDKSNNSIEGDLNQ